MDRSSAPSVISNPEEQVLDPATSLVYRTYLSVISDDRELCQRVARIYQRLSERRVQMEHLRIMIRHKQQSSYDSSIVDNFLDFVSSFRESLAITQLSSATNTVSMFKSMPEQLQSPLRRLLEDTENFGSVTNVFVHLRENKNGRITVDMARVGKTENMLKRHMSNESRLLQDIEHLSCPHFTESQVIFKRRLSCYRYKVWVGDRDFIERKVPFASAGLQGDNLSDDFTGEVKRLAALRGCGGIAQFLGVIFDDTRRHVKGYLYEAPVFHNLELLIGLASSQFKLIPWAVRELWMGQIVAAMSNIHARGFVVGGLNNNHIGIRADRTAVLDLGDCSRQLPNGRDCLPPELREMGFDTYRVPSSIPLNFQTHVFQLGFYSG
ncbi:MAG: hypothetical protein Q9167_004092 [Letrouitia subvulpina]